MNIPEKDTVISVKIECPDEVRDLISTGEMHVGLLKCKNPKNGGIEFIPPNRIVATK